MFPRAPRSSRSGEPADAFIDHDPTPVGLMVEGHPLRKRNGRVALAHARRGHSHLTDRQALHLPIEVRHALADHWRAQGELEHSSVAAYRLLARRLALLDAPETLIRRALMASVQEADHWTRCFDLAGRYFGQSVRPGRLRRPIRLPRTRRAELAALAVETLRDGVLLERYASRTARIRAQRATDPRVIDTLQVIAADEAAHADLCCDVVVWCLSEGGEPVAHAIRTAARALPTRGPGLAPTGGARERMLADHGLFDADPHGQEWLALIAEVRAQVVARLEGRPVPSAA